MPQMQSRQQMTVQGCPHGCSGPTARALALWRAHLKRDLVLLQLVSRADSVLQGSQLLLQLLHLLLSHALPCCHFSQPPAAEETGSCRCNARRQSNMQAGQTNAVHGGEIKQASTSHLQGCER